jgi:hypothetical protein
MNPLGLVCFLSYVLAEECGVNADRQIIAKRAEFFGRYIDRGGIPLGDMPLTS